MLKIEKLKDEIEAVVIRFLIFSIPFMTGRLF